MLLLHVNGYISSYGGNNFTARDVFLTLEMRPLYEDQIGCISFQ